MSGEGEEVIAESKPLTDEGHALVFEVMRKPDGGGFTWNEIVKLVNAVEIGEKRDPVTILETIERDAWNDIIRLHDKLLEDLIGNHAELAQAIHVLQQFVIMRALARLAPDVFGRWYGKAWAEEVEHD